MRQTWAILVDAYRELNAKKLFWVVMLISAAVVGGLALLGNNDRGMTFAGLTLELPFFSTRAMSHAGFYKLIFVDVGIHFWLAWGATILALISTAGMIPDFVSGGAIELVMSKPIGRARLFLTKYAAGLLFVTLQVLTFSLGGFLVIGLRGGAWVPTVFLAVPLVVVFYSYLFCVCALVGVVTRSGIAALLLTMVVWLGLWAINKSEVVLLQVRVGAAREVEREEARVRSLEKSAALLREEANKPAEPSDPPAPAAESPPRPPEGTAGDEAPPPRPGGRRRGSGGDGAGGFLGALGRIMHGGGGVRPGAPARERLAQVEQELAQANARLGDDRKALTSLTRWHRGLYAAKTLFPKTGETTELLKRYIIDPADREGFLKVIEESTRGDASARQVEEAIRARPVSWVVGTSLGFEAVVLGLAVVVFCRRDF